MNRHQQPTALPTALPRHEETTRDSTAVTPASDTRADAGDAGWLSRHQWSRRVSEPNVEEPTVDVRVVKYCMMFVFNEVDKT